MSSNAALAFNEALDEAIELVALTTLEPTHVSLDPDELAADTEELAARQLQSCGMPERRRMTAVEDESLTSRTGAFVARQADSRGLDAVENNNDCPICLDALSTKGIFGQTTLCCGHKYCISCLTEYVNRQHSTRSIACPCCRVVVRPPAIIAKSMPERSGDEAVMPRLNHRRPAPPPRRHSNGSAHWWNAGPRLTAADTEALARQAGRNAWRLRLCPECSAPICKNGGCDNMNCPCGARFQWSQAQPLRACRHCHYDPEARFFPRYKACIHCSALAEVEAKALCAVGRTLEVTVSTVGVISAVAVFASVGLAVTAVPAAVFGPLALAYEPVRRTVKPLRKKKNHLAWAAASGAIVTTVSLCRLVEYDSD